MVRGGPLPGAVAGPSEVHGSTTGLSGSASIATASGATAEITATPGAALHIRRLDFISNFDLLAAELEPLTPSAPATASVTSAEIDARVESLPVLPTMVAESTLFRGAARELSQYLARVVGGGTPVPKPTLPIAELTLAMMGKMAPATTLPSPVSVPPAGAESPSTSATPAPPPAEMGSRSLPGPSFPQPMYEFLRDLAPDLLLPGMAGIEPDSVTLLETNPPFIEAYMVGLNHELSRELLWREYPSDLRATGFHHFWGGPTGMPDMHSWSAEAPLGSNLDAGSDDQQLVLLIRGELLHRYPRTVIYASPVLDPTTPGPEKRYPIFRAALGPDITCLGFNLTAEEVRGEEGDPGWFFVLEQPPGQPRFGLDASTETGREPAALNSWNDVAWGDLAEDDGSLTALTHVPVAGRLGGHRIGGLEWGLNSGHMAGITLQRPVRVLLRGRDLLTPAEEVVDV
jgi:hypothetical protein